MLVLLAQLIAPPLQNSPIRLPSPALEQPGRGPAKQPSIILNAPIEAAPAGPSQSPQGLKDNQGRIAPPQPPLVKGDTPYTRQQLTKILQTCSLDSQEDERLNKCASELQSRLTNDGYTNSRVYVFKEPAPAHLLVIQGKIVELRVRGGDSRLNAKVYKLLRPIVGKTFQLASVERSLQQLQSRPEISSVRSQLSRLGSDPTQAALTVTVEAAAPAWQGELSLRNDGSPGSGQARATASLLRPSLLKRGDSLLLYGELNGNESPALGQATSSLSYTYPLGTNLNIAGAFGTSRQQQIELPPPANSYTTTQLQGLGQLEWVLNETLDQRWSMAVAYSGSTSTNRLNNQALPSSLPERLREPKSGYLRLEVNGSGLSSSLYWAGQIYGLQGIAAATPANQLQELASADIFPGRSNAIGTFVSLGWNFSPRWQFALRGGGQQALHKLTEPMRFSIGSDAGIRGLPGQLISGDSGWLGSAELAWTVWNRPGQLVQLVPFIGTGAVSTKIGTEVFADSAGSVGMLTRWLAGERWSTEVGWIRQFSTQNNAGTWNDWLLGNGLYTKISYRF